VESLGEKLRITREEKAISLDQAGKDTKITVRYIQALEQEDFSVFPGEAYITGFLRNYSVYLGLDTQEILSLYRAFKIQEQPIPVEQLLKRPSLLPKIALIVLAAILVFGLIGGGIYLLISNFQDTENIRHISREPQEYLMTGDVFERQFFIGDSILITDVTDQLKFELLNINETVTLQTPVGILSLDLGQEENVLLNNGISILGIKVLDFARNNADMGTRLHFEINDAVENIPYLVFDEETAAAVSAGISTPTVSTVLINSPNPYPFILQVNFQGNCMFRWEILAERDRRDRNERFFQRAEELEIQAQNGIRIWVPNAQAAKFQVIGGGRTVPFEIGAAGEVVVADVRWVRDENRFRLIVTRLER